MYLCSGLEKKERNVFRKMRRIRQQLSNEDSIAILEKVTSGTLALLGDDGYPQMIRFDIEHLTGKEAIELTKG